MSAGELRDRIRIEQPTKTVGAGGQPLVAWTRYAARFAKVNWENGNEREGQGRMKVWNGWRVMLRYDVKLTTEMRVVFGTHTLEIQGMTHDRRRRYHFLSCTEAT